MAKKNPTDATLHAAQLRAARAQTPQQALGILAHSTTFLMKAGEWKNATPPAMLFYLDAAADFFTPLKRDAAAGEMYAHVYNAVAPHVNFSKGFRQRLKTRVNKWGASADLQPLWDIAVLHGNDVMPLLQEEAAKLEAYLDPYGAVYDLSNDYYERSEEYVSVTYHTKDFPAFAEEAYDFTRRIASYDGSADTVRFMRARMPQNGKANVPPTTLSAFLENAQLTKTDGNFYYMTQLRDACLALEAIAHETIHQFHSRCYQAAVRHPHARRYTLGMTYEDVLLTKASILALMPANAARRRLNKTETLISETLLQSKIGAKTAFQPN